MVCYPLVNRKSVNGSRKKPGISIEKAAAESRQTEVFKERKAYRLDYERSISYFQ